MGALTSKPYAFTARSWELRTIDSIDVLDVEGVNTKINVRGNTIMRILPRINYDINMEWVSDRARFSYDGNNRQRILSPLLNFRTSYSLLSNSLTSISWSDALKAYERFFRINGKSSISLVGSTLDFETISTLFKFSSNLGQSHNLFLNDLSRNRNIDLVSYFSFSLPFSFFSTFLEACVFVGFSPRLESPVFNIRLRNLVSQNGLKIFTFGYTTNLNYPSFNFGNSVVPILKLFEAKHKNFCKLLKVRNLAFVFGNSVFSRADFSSLFNGFHFIALKFLLPKVSMVNFNVMLPSVSLANSFYLGLNYAVRWFFTSFKTINFFHSFSANSVKFKHFVPVLVFQGSHFEDGNLIYFPSLTYFEKNSIFRNAEGRFQLAHIAVSPVSDKIKNDWRIVKALGDYMDVALNNAASSKLLLNKIEDLTITKKIFFDSKALLMMKSAKINFSNFVSVGDHYLIDSLTRNSVTMALVAAVLNDKFSNFN